jgi:hypothetical protein
VTDVSALLDDLGRLPDEGAREKVRTLVGSVLDMHGAALAPLVAALRARGGDEAVLDVSKDAAVGSVLVLHGLHPLDARTRVRSAIAGLGPTLRDMNASASLDETAAEVLRVRVVIHHPGRPGADALVEAAVAEAAPDASVVVESARDDPSLLPLSRLTSSRRVQPQAADPSEACDMCAAQVGPEHEHVFDPAARELRCACPACASLFSSTAGRWKRVARRKERIGELRLDDEAWNDLGLPIELAFFYRSTHAARVVAMYPGPAGATESTLPLDAWSRIERDNPLLRDLAPDVEALLVRRTRSGREHYRVSIDACFALAGRIRKHWKGLGGGQEAWDQIGDFFADLQQSTQEGRPCSP